MDGLSAVVVEEDPTRLPDGSIIEDIDIAPLDVQTAYSEARASAGTTESLASRYGQPVSAEEAEKQCPAGGGGLIYHAHLLRGKESDVLADGTVRPRRPNLPVLGTDFFTSLVKVADGRWIFSGVLDGWPGLTCLELLSITTRETRDANLFRGAKTLRFWDYGSSKAPTMPPGSSSVRATLRAGPWSVLGYTPETRGHVWWFFGQREAPQMAFGERILEAVSPAGEPEPQAVKIHLFAHRYAKAVESTKDTLTYHSAILLEWSHGRFCTVVELATLHGVGGRRGKVNWCHDKLEERPALYKAMQPELCSPFIGECAEIRCTDVTSKSLDEFKQYISTYTGTKLRFLDPSFDHSAPVRLTHRSQSDVVRYLLNYVGREHRYTEKVHNCQAFAADFLSFMAAKRDIVPHSSYLQPLYNNRSHLFLYDAAMFEAPPLVEASRYDGYTAQQASGGGSV